MRTLKARLEKLEVAHLAEQRAARDRCVRRLLGRLSPDEVGAWLMYYAAREGIGPPLDAETEPLALAAWRKWEEGLQALTPAEVDLWEWAAVHDPAPDPDKLTPAEVIMIYGPEVTQYDKT